MISLTVVILTLAVVFIGFWMVIKFSKGEELRKDYRDKYNHKHHKRGA